MFEISLPKFSSDESDNEVKTNEQQQGPQNILKNRPNESILKKQLSILEENPFTENYATIMKRPENFNIIIKIIEKACCITLPVDTSWLLKCFKELTKEPNQLEDLDFCRKHILKYAQSAEYEAQLKLNNDKIISQQLLRLRLKVDEKVSSFNSRSTSKKRSIESVEKQVSADDEFDPYLKRNEESEDIFVKQPSPVIEPIHNGSINNESIDDDSHLLNNVSRAISIPIASIDKIRPSTKPKELTKRQQIIQRIAGDTYDSVPSNYVFETHGRIKKKLKKNNIKQSKVTATKSRILLKSHQVPQNSRAADINSYDDDILSSSSEEISTDLEDLSNSSNQTIQIASSSSSGSIQIINVKKSISIRSIKPINGIRCKKKVHFADGTLFPNVYQSTNPAYSKQKAQTLSGQTIITFTRTHRILTNRGNTPASASDSSTLFKKVPSSDYPIKISRRDNPLIKKNREISEIKSSIFDDLMELLNRSFTSSRLFIVDSIMEPLDTDIFKNMAICSLGYPRMPEWFIDALERWWTNGKKHFNFTKVFILLGMDLNIYYADPNARQEEVVINFLKNLHKWFEDKLKTVRNDVLLNSEENKYTLCFTKTVPNEDGIMVSVSQKFFLLSQTPIFVVITVPEIGDWEVFFQGLNDELRKFVNENKRNFILLDWANILKNMNPNDVSTVEKRTAILIREMFREHGVLYY